MPIRVYAHVDVDELRKLAPVIASLLFRGAADENFSISPGSGWLHYSDPERIRGDVPPANVPAREADARNAALAFLVRAEQAMAGDGRLRGLGAKSILPPVDDLLPIQTTPVRRETGELDHWVVRFLVSIRASDSLREPAAAVAGAGVDVRIGERGNVIALTSRWTPLREGSSMRRRRLHVPERIEGAREARLVYRLGDEAMRQSLLAPYWLVGAGHHAMFFPASDCSLICDVLQTTEHDSITLTAVTAGGSGSYEYQWGYAPVLESPPRIELIPANTRRLSFGRTSTTVSSVTVKKSVCDVLIDVRDLSTGASAQFRRSIYPLLEVVSTPAVHGHSV
jgi:hypothetical protein